MLLLILVWFWDLACTNDYCSIGSCYLMLVFGCLILVVCVGSLFLWVEGCWWFAYFVLCFYCLIVNVFVLVFWCFDCFFYCLWFRYTCFGLHFAVFMVWCYCWFVLSSVGLFIALVLALRLGLIVSLMAVVLVALLIGG